MEPVCFRGFWFFEELLEELLCEGMVLNKVFKKLIVLLLCLAILSGFLTGCAAQEGKQDVQQNQGDRRTEVVQEIVAGLGRDPGTMYGYGAHPPLTRVLEPLVFQDLDLGLIPGPAAKWEVSDDGLIWEISLRDDIVFHDGNAFNAEAVIHNLERIAKTWPTRLGPVVKMEAVDDYKVKVTHSEPFSSFLYSLAWAGSAMISPAAINEDGSVREPIGTGPYIRASWTPDEEMVLVKNESYWGGTPILERITLKFIPDPTTRMMALRAGEIDMIIDTGGVLPEQVATLKSDPNIEVLTVAGAVPHYMTLNTQKPPFNDQKVRQAVMHAVDPASMIEHVLEGYGAVMATVIPYSEKDWMHPDKLLAFNQPDRARELLAEAGWRDTNQQGILTKNGEELRAKFLLSSALVNRWPYGTIAEVVQAQLGEIGIAVNIEIVESGLWQQTLMKGNAEISIRPWAGISPQTRLYDWLHSQGENTVNMGIFYHNPTVDGLIEELLRTTDDLKAKQISHEIQEIAAQEVPIIPMYDEVLINAVRSNIKGYKLHPWFTVNWEHIYVE